MPNTYRLFRNGVTALYLDKPENYQYVQSAQHPLALKLDTILPNGDSIFVHTRKIMERVRHFYPVPYQINCADGTFEDTLWIGNRIVITADGRQLLTTLKNDTLTLRTQASKGQSWKAMKYADGSGWDARVDSVYQDSLLTLPDSLKIISFWRKNADNTPMAHDSNGVQMIVSRQYGLVRTPSIRDFPEYRYTLTGLDSPKKGVQNLTVRQIFNWQAGDVFHTVTVTDCPIPPLGGVVPYPFCDPYTTKTIVEILQSSLSADGDTLRWKAKVCNAKTGVCSIVDRVLVYDELVNHLFLDSLSYTTKFVSNYSTMGLFQGAGACGNLATKSYLFLYSVQGQDSCRASAFEETGNHIYIEGCGGPFYSAWYEVYSERELVYYKKGNITCGTPLVVSNKSLVSNRLAVKLSPVPCSTFADFTFDGADFEGTLVLHDLFGRKLAVQTIRTTDKYRYELPNNLSAGTYLVTLTNAKGQTQCLKLLKE